MREATTQALAAINRAFYREHGRAFSQTRAQPWPGWQRVLAQRPARAPLRVLDAGAGNGRFGALLQRTCAEPVAYLGLDESEPLVAEAAERLGHDPGYEVRACDLTAGLPERRFDLVVLFAVLHHVPSFARRRALLRALAARVDVGGKLAISFWRLDPEAQAEKRLDWGRAPAIDPADLEAGDQLLSFQRDGLRYCHFSPDPEISELCAALPLRLSDDFCADGKHGDANRYLLFEREA